MSISTLEWKELPDGLVFFYRVNFLGTGTGKTNVLRGGQHGKLRLLKANIITAVHDTTAPQAKIEDAAANVATATTTASATANTVTAMTLGSYTVFDADEDIDVNVSTGGGGATSAYAVEMYLVSTR